MYLVWLRVAAVLYAGAGIAAFPTVLYQNPRWRSICVHVGGLAFLFHLVSVVEMLALAHSWVPMGVREGESLLGLVVAGLRDDFNVKVARALEIGNEVAFSFIHQILVEGILFVYGDKGSHSPT